MKRLVVDNQDNFSGGLRDVAARVRAPNEVATLTNGRVLRNGALAKRGGTRQIHSAAVDGTQDIQGGFSWNYSGGVLQLIIVNGRLYTGTYTTSITWTARGMAADFSSSATPRFAQFYDGSNEAVYIADGGLLNKYVPTTVTTNIASTPAVVDVVTYNQRLFGITGTNETLYWSALNNGDTLGIAASGGGEAIVRSFGAGPIVGLAVVGPVLYMLHKRGISRFTGWGQEDIGIDAGTRGVATGLAFHSKGYVVLDDTLYVMANGVVYAVNDLGVADLSKDRVTTGIVQNAIAVAIHATDEILLGQMGSSYLLYNKEMDAWSKLSLNTAGLPTILCAWAAVDDNNLPVVFLGGSDSFVYRFDQGVTDAADVNGSNGNDYTFSVTTRNLFQKPKHAPVLLRRVGYRGSTFNAPTIGYVAYDQSGTNTVSSAVPAAAGASNIAEAVIQAGHKGDSIQLTYSDAASTSNAPSLLYSLWAEGYVLGPRARYG